MKKILIALLWISYLLWNVFAVNDVYIVENNIKEIKNGIATTENNSLSQEDIDYLCAFFDEVKVELEK